jgi:GR25 family glycosyltransferase involved in LPS biosynthesis
MFKILLLIIVALIVLYIINLCNENFIDDKLVDYYVIHISTNKKRSDNINLMSNKINNKINIFEAIKGSEINNVLDFDANINFNFKYNHINEVGCYLSHLLLIKSLINSNYKYTIIFEDDFNIKNDSFNNEVNNILNSVDDFDILYLGNLNDNHGNNYKDNIYYINKKDYLWGTHAYIINNKNAHKIYNNLLNLDLAIDNKYKYLIEHNFLNGYVIYPIIVNIINDESSIQGSTFIYNN